MALTIMSTVLLGPHALKAQDYDRGLKAAHSGDFATALKEWKQLAEQGDAPAQHTLGLMYYNGDGVIQDTMAAHMWFNIAAANGHAKAVKNRDIAANKLSAADIVKAQQMAKRCMNSGYKDCGQ